MCVSVCLYGVARAHVLFWLTCAAYRRCYAFVGLHKEALEDCRLAVTIDGNYAKGYARMGQIFVSLEQYQDAHRAYTRAAAIDSAVGVEMQNSPPTYRHMVGVADE